VNGVEKTTIPVRQKLISITGIAARNAKPRRKQRENSNFPQESEAVLFGQPLFPTKYKHKTKTEIQIIK